MANELAKYRTIYRRRRKEDDDALGGLEQWPDYMGASGGGYSSGGGGGLGNAGGYVAPSNALLGLQQGAPPAAVENPPPGSDGGGNEASRGLDENGNAQLGPNPGLPGTLEDALLGLTTVMPIGPLSLAGFVALSEKEKAQQDIDEGKRTPRAQFGMTIGMTPNPGSIADISAMNDRIGTGREVSPSQEDQNLAELNARAYQEASQSANAPPGGGYTSPGQVDQDLANANAAAAEAAANSNSGYGGDGGNSSAGDAGSSAGGGSGDAAGCFVAGTMITMADGTTKAIELIQIGDKVKAFDEFTGELGDGEVTDLRNLTRDGIVKVDGVLVSKNHRFMTPDGWKEIGRLEPGDKLINADGSEHVIQYHRRRNRPRRVYNFTVSPQRTYIANGWRVHNIKIRGGKVYNRTGQDMAPGNPDDTQITAKANEWVIQEPTAEYYGDEIMQAFNAGEFPKNALMAMLEDNDAEFTPRRGRNALAEMAR